MILLSFDERRALFSLLEARIAFRKRWIMSQAPKRKQVQPWHVEALNAYDDENNFARMGAEHVDAAWGLVLKAHPKKIKVKRPKSTRAALMAAQAINPHHHERATA